MNKIKDQIIVIIGANGGFGRALASQIAPQGPKLVLASTAADSLSDLAESVKLAGATDVSTHSVDATDEASVSALFEAVKKQYGHADTLVYLPGLSVASPVTDMPVESYDKIFDVNLKGFFLASKHFVPITQPERNPLITFISSQAATRANPNAPLYCSVKAAMSMFGEGLALQLMQKNIRVTSIKPGPVDTQGFWGDRPVPREKFMQASEVAEVIEFVLSLPSHIVMHEVSFESFNFFKK